MSTIASLSVLLGLDSSGFDAGAKKAEGSLSSLASKVTGFASTAAGALGVGLSVGAFTHFISGCMESIDATAKLSDRLGITTQALIRLQHAGDLEGTGADSVNRGLEMMTKHLGTLVRDGGEGADMLARFGLNVTELAQMAPDQAFMRIADAVSQVQNPVERATVATTLFGKSGQELLNVLMAGRNGLQAMGDDAERLRLTMGRLSAEKVKEANDAIQRMHDAVKGIGFELSIKLAPAVEKISNGLAGLFSKIPTDLLLGGLPLLLNQFDDGTSAVNAALAQQAALLSHLSEKAATAAEEVKGLSGATMSWVDIQNSIAGEVQDLTMDLQTQIATFGQSADAVTLYKLSMKGASDQQLAMVDSLQKQLAAMKDAQEAMQGMAQDFVAQDVASGGGRLARMGGAVEHRFVEGRRGIQDDFGDKVSKTIKAESKLNLKALKNIESALKSSDGSESIFDFPA